MHFDSITQNSVFISGSISITELPDIVIESLDKVIKTNLPVLVGDARGVDVLVQEYLALKQYINVTVYTVESKPRNLSSNSFKIKNISVDDEIKKERHRQQEKDKAMTCDCRYSFVVWDGKSKGSYSNILSALSLEKEIKIYLSSLNDFLLDSRVNRNNIDKIYRDNNGYSASEIIDILSGEGYSNFNRSQDLYKFLLQKGVVEKIDKSYSPLSHVNLFIVKKYRGKQSNLAFKSAFIDWIKNRLNKSGEQMTLF
jgi:hypothetical protein